MSSLSVRLYCFGAYSNNLDKWKQLSLSRASNGSDLFRLVFEMSSPGSRRQIEEALSCLQKSQSGIWSTDYWITGSAETASSNLQDFQPSSRAVAYRLTSDSPRPLTPNKTKLDTANKPSGCSFLGTISDLDLNSAWEFFSLGNEIVASEKFLEALCDCAPEISYQIVDEQNDAEACVAFVLSAIDCVPIIETALIEVLQCQLCRRDVPRYKLAGALLGVRPESPIVLDPVSLGHFPSRQPLLVSCETAERFANRHPNLLVGLEPVLDKHDPIADEIASTESLLASFLRTHPDFERRVN